MAAKPATVGGVELGHFARLGDGSWVRVVAILHGQPFVRPAEGEPLHVVGEGALVGPRPIPRHTKISDVRAPAAAARDAAPVADPLGSTASSAGPTLFHLGGTS
jgi:hypothetical protein